MARFNQITSSLATMHRHRERSIGINYQPHTIPANITVILKKDGGVDYHPLIAVRIGDKREQLKATIDTVFSASSGILFPTLTHQFVENILYLWKEVLHAWIQAPG